MSGFDGFVEGVLPDPADRDLVQRWCGTLLLAPGSRPRFVVLRGDARIGKRALVRLMRRWLRRQGKGGAK